MKVIDKFNDFTVQDNMGFKIAFGDIVVSVCSHNYLDAMLSMEGNGLAGRNIDYSNSPRNMMALTFDNAEICIFNQQTDETITELFIDNNNYDAYSGCGWISPDSFVDVLVKVREYTKTI